MGPQATQSILGMVETLAAILSKQESVKCVKQGRDLS